MKNLICLLLLTFFATLGAAQDNQLQDFDKIKISGNFVVELFNADVNAYDLSVLKGKDSDVIIEVENGLLKVKARHGYKAKKRLKANLKIYHDGISRIDIGAGANVKSKDPIEAKALAIDVSSGAACQLVVAALETDLEASSGSNCQVSGETNSLTAEASSGSRLDATMLASKAVDAQVSSGASITVWAKESIIAEASSGGSIQYKGEPAETDIDAGKYSGGSISKM